MVSLDAEDEVSNLHSKVDLVITLGGDGTVLWVYYLILSSLCQILSYLHTIKEKYHTL